MFLSAVSPALPLILYPKGTCIMGNMGAKVGNACEEFEDSEGGILR